MGTVTMLIGLPASGKSTYAEHILCKNTILLSSDHLRVELYGEEVQDKNTELFEELHRRLLDYLDEGFDVIYDATNISRKRRIHFINNIAKNHKVNAVMVYTPYEIIKDRNLNRERNVPLEKLDMMLKGFQPPLYLEGFRDIKFITGYKSFKIPLLTLGAVVDRFGLLDYDQDNPHHDLTLDKHIEKVSENTLNNNCTLIDRIDLYRVALLHDIGKPFCRIKRTDGHMRSSYFNHENVSSYFAIEYLLGEHENVRDRILMTISYHIAAHGIKNNNSEKSKAKFIKKVGIENYDLIMTFEKCDSEGKGEVE